MRIIRTYKIILTLVSILILNLITGFFPIENCTASGNTIFVDDDFNNSTTGWQIDHFDRIQDGVDAANSEDTIYVYIGTYNENIEISKNLTITGQNKDTTIIDGGKKSHVIHVYGSIGNPIKIQISGFTIRNAGTFGDDCIALSYAKNSNINNNKILNSDESDGIQLDHCEKVTINNNIIKNNEGSGISGILSEENIIHNNIIQSNQKGIYLQGDSSTNNQIYQNTITGNSQYGIHIFGSSNNRFYHNDFTDNDQNAQDSSTNYWSYNSQGNYWDDYNGYDDNSDGIGDIPYTIPGGSNADDYPLGYFKESQSSSGNQRPIAYLPSISPNPATYGQSVLFSGSGWDSDGYIVGYSWRSSIDGQLNTKNEFSSLSLSSGTHFIYFKVKDNDGDWSSEKTTTLVINSIEDKAPNAYIDSIAPNPATTEQKVYFIGHGTDDGEIIEYKWISSLDGVMSSNKSFNSSGLSTGSHTIYFQVKDDDNRWSNRDTEILIIGDYSLNLPPVADAGGVYSGHMNKKITFDGSGSYDKDGSIVEYLWEFGDGILGTGKTQKHTYTAPGNYSITLTVTDNNGYTSTDSTYAAVFKSVNESGSSESFLGFNIEVPFPLVIVFAPIIIIVIIVFFLYWFKRK